MPKSLKDVPYHHGDLREAMISAATAHVEQTRDWSFSLRAIAKKVGVSHNAPYAHFQNKTALLGAVAARGFELLTSSLNKARRSAVGGDKQAVVAGLAYIDFGRAHPGLYRLMFDPLFAGNPPTIVEQTGKIAFDQIVKILDDLAEKGYFPKAETPAKAFAAWALAHGMTSLILDHRNITGPFDDQLPLPSSVEDGLTSLIHGFMRPTY